MTQYSMLKEFFDICVHKLGILVNLKTPFKEVIFLKGV